MKVKEMREIKKQPDGQKKPLIKRETNTACSCGCKPPPRKEK